MDDLKYLKKHYGEQFAHYCRSSFPTILEKEGELSKIVSNLFAPTKYLYESLKRLGDESSFCTLINMQFLKENNIKVNTNLSPEELMDKAGYILYPECKTEKEIQSFKKYYKPLEELCTFNGGRLDTCRVWFAVKKDVNKIIRENFVSPKRQDEYGTSVISIQFTKSGNFLSIKNRYNHTVENPDATFSNCLDNIILGLTDAFNKKYNVNTNVKFTIPQFASFVKASDGKFYHYNFLYNGCFYCDDNYIVDSQTGNVVQFDKNSSIFMDQYIVDLKNKTISRFKDKEKKDTFMLLFKAGIKDISVVKDEENGRLVNFILKDNNIIRIKLDKTNNIEEYYNKNATKIGKMFLLENQKLRKISLPNVEEIDDGFMYFNAILKQVDLPKLRVAHNDFLSANISLEQLDVPCLEKAGSQFLYSNFYLSELNAPNLVEVGEDCLCGNVNLTEINLPKLKTVKNYFLTSNTILSSINMPELESAKNFFINNAKFVYKVDFPKLKKVGNSFLEESSRTVEANFPLLEEVGNNFLSSNKNLTDLNMPNIQSAGDKFLADNFELSKVDFPKLKKVGLLFLRNNFKIKELNLPKLEAVGKGFLKNNVSLKCLSLPSLKIASDDFMFHNKEMEKLEVPNLEVVGKWFMPENIKLKFIDMPKLEFVGDHFLNNWLYTEKLKTFTHKSFNLPNLKYVGDSFLEYAPKKLIKAVLKNSATKAKEQNIDKKENDLTM